MPRVISKYIFKEVSVPFLLSLLILTATALLSKVVRLVELTVSYGVGGGFILEYFASVVPSFLIYIIPVSFLVAVLTAFARLSSDSEVTAMKSSGLGLYDILKPVIALAIIVFTLNLVITLYLFPWGNQNIKKLVIEASRSASTSGIDEGVFYDRFKGATLYVDRIAPNTGEMEGIIISQETPKGANIFIARRGILAQPDVGDSVYFKLFDGSVHRQERDSQTYHTADFSSYMLEMTVAESRTGIKTSKSNKELYPGELYDKIKEVRSLGFKDAPFVIDFHKRFTLPASIFVFALIGVPLGIQKVRSARLTGFSVALGLVIAYYVLTTSLEALGETGRVNPLIAVWGSDVLFAIAGIYLFYRAANDRPLMHGMLRFIRRRQGQDKGKGA